MAGKFQIDLDQKLLTIHPDKNLGNLQNRLNKLVVNEKPPAEPPPTLSSTASGLEDPLPKKPKLIGNSSAA